MYHLAHTWSPCHGLKLSLPNTSDITYTSGHALCCCLPKPTIPWLSHWEGSFITFGRKDYSGFGGVSNNNITVHSLAHINMMTSSNGNFFPVIGPVCGEFTGHRWIPLTKASDAELWCFLWCAPEQTVVQQSRCWWFEMQLHSLWRHCNGTGLYLIMILTFCLHWSWISTTCTFQCQGIV